MAQKDAASAPPALPTAALVLPAPLVLPALTSVRVVLRHAGALAQQVSALPHAVAAISSFLDYALPQFWSLPRACEANLLSRLPHLAARILSAGVDPFFWKYQCRQGLVFAVKHDNLEMVELLHEYCPTVLPYLPMVEAARVGNLRMLQWLSDCHERVPWLPRMMDAAASTGQLSVLQWLHGHPKNVGCIADAFESAVAGGHLDTVKWLLAHYGDGERIVWCDISEANSSQIAEVVKLLFEHHPRKFGHELPSALDWFAGNGDLEMVQWLYAKSSEPGFSDITDRLDTKLIDQAASFGHLHVVQWLHEQYTDGWMPAAMNGAAERGHLDIIQWFQENRTERCTSRAMDEAACGGHLVVVKWLHENRTEGCTTQAMDLAARYGHQSTVKWLHENRTEGCTPQAMDFAARHGHLEVVKWLHENRDEGCTEEAMQRAIDKGHFDVLLFLDANRSEGFGSYTVDDSEMCIKHMEIVQWLYANDPNSIGVGRLISQSGSFMPGVLEHILGQASELDKCERT